MSSISIFNELLDYFEKQSKDKAIKLKTEIIKSKYSKYGTLAYVDENNPEAEPICFCYQAQENSSTWFPIHDSQTGLGRLTVLALEEFERLRKEKNAEGIRYSPDDLIKSAFSYFLRT